MSARIRFRGGPLAGQVFAFDDDVDRIVIGRDPARCQVVLPADLAGVGREHLALERSLGRYRLVLSPHHPVLLDGKPALGGTELADVATLRLGPEGPVLVVQTLGSTEVPATLGPDLHVPDVPELVADAVQRTRLNRQIVALTAGIVLLLVAVGVLALRETASRVRTVTEEQAAVRGMVETEAALREKIAAEQAEATKHLRERLEGVSDSLEKLQPDLTGLRQAVSGLGEGMQGLEERVRRLTPRIREALQQAVPSVYMVVMRTEDGLDDAVGTAWVAGPGVLVSNAHVARLFELVATQPQLARTRLVVRSPGKAPRDHAVASVTLHPGWATFGEIWEEYRPTDVDVLGHLSPLYTAGACDVALLHVEEGDALAPPLPIAPQEALEALAPGDVVGFVGYPAEDMASGGVNLQRPAPTVQVAHVTAVTNFFLAPDDPPEALLVQHSLPATGGASGSPILDPDGRVVAVLNAGNVTVGGMGQRIPSAVLVNFAQRADLVRELLSGQAAPAQEARTQRWREGIRTFTSLRAAVERDALAYRARYLTEVGAREGTAPEQVLDQTGVLGSDQAAPPPLATSEVPFHVPGPGVYVLFAFAPMGQSVGLVVADAASPTTPIDRDAADHWYAILQVRAAKEGDVVIRVAGLTDTEYRLLVDRFPPPP